MHIFRSWITLPGIDVMDLPETIRSQIPSFPDTDLRGFTGGIASRIRFHVLFIIH